MLIYHLSDGKQITTQVILGGSRSKVSHGVHVWDKHKDEVAKLEDGGDVFVTGATYAGAKYKGEFVSRERFKHYIESI